MPKGKASANLALLWKEYEEYLEPGNKSQANRTRFPSGVLGLDLGLGNIEGMTRGIVEILGGESVGKTTLALTILAHSQKTGKLTEIEAPDGGTYNAVYMDFEHSYDNVYAEALGVDTAKMLVLTMTYTQQQFTVVEYLLEAGIQFVIIDSIAVTIPQSEEDKELDDNEKMSDEAKTLGRAMKRVNALAAASDALILTINQYRANMSPMAHTEKKGYGAWLLRYLKKVTIELTRIERKETRMTIQAFIQKNKLGALGKKLTYDIEHGKGIDLDHHILILAEDNGIVDKNKAWWYYTGLDGKEYKGQGEQNAVKNFPIAEIKQRLIEMLKNTATETESEEDTVHE